MMTLVWRSTSQTADLDEFWPLAGFEFAETHRRGEQGFRGKTLNTSGFAATIPIVPEDSVEALEAAMIDFIEERQDALSILRERPEIKNEFDLLLTVGSRDAFARIVTFSPGLLDQ